MAICSARSLLYLHSFANISNPPGSPFLVPAKFSSKLALTTQRISTVCRRTANRQDQPVLPDDHTELDFDISRSFPREISKLLVVGAVSFGVAFYLIGWDGERALALGPEGPLMEEFWENIRRYAIYALTVSTGAIYTIFQPILELLKNPISAILVLAILGGGIYVVSQVVYAMVGVSNFTYDYGGTVRSGLARYFLGSRAVEEGVSGGRSSQHLQTKIWLEKKRLSGFQMPLHYPSYKKWRLDPLLYQYGLSLEGTIQKRVYAMGKFLWPDPSIFITP